MKLTDKEVLGEIRDVISRNPQFAKFNSVESKMRITDLYDRISRQAELRNIYQDKSGQEAIIGDIMVGLGYGESDATIFRRWSENKHESFFENFMYKGAFEDVSLVLNNLGYTDSVLRGLRYNQDAVIYSDDSLIEVSIKWSNGDGSSPRIEEFSIKYKGRTVFDLKEHMMMAFARDEYYTPTYSLSEKVEQVKHGDFSNVSPRPTKTGKLNSFSVNDTWITSDMNVEKRVSRNGHKYLYDTVNHKILGGWKV